MPRPRRVVDYPRTDPVTGGSIGKVVISPLTGEEARSCAIEADRRTLAALKQAPRSGEVSYGYDTIYNMESTYQILFRSVTRAEVAGVAFFPSPEKLAT